MDDEKFIIVFFIVIPMAILYIDMILSTIKDIFF